MSKRIFISISIITIAALGMVVYVGIYSLKPRAYAPQPAASPRAAATGFDKLTTSRESPATSTTLMHGKEPSAKSQAQNATDVASKSTFSAATDEEIKKYSATLPRDVNPAVFKLNLLDVRAVAVGPNEIMVMERPSAEIFSSVWKFNMKTKTLVPIAERERGLMMRWFENGRFALQFSITPANIPSLLFIETKTNRRIPLIFTTLPDKCAVGGDQPIIYCGVPKILPPGVILPDDYLKKKLYTDDRIVMMDMGAMRVRELGNEAMPRIDLYHPAIIGNALFFINRYDDTLYKLPL